MESWAPPCWPRAQAPRSTCSCIARNLPLHVPGTQPHKAADVEAFSSPESRPFSELSLIHPVKGACCYQRLGYSLGMLVGAEASESRGRVGPGRSLALSTTPVRPQEGPHGLWEILTVSSQILEVIQCTLP